MASLRATHAKDVTNRCNKQTNASIKQTVPKCITLYKGYPVQMYTGFSAPWVSSCVDSTADCTPFCTKSVLHISSTSNKTHVGAHPHPWKCYNHYFNIHSCDFLSESGADIWFQNFCFQIQILDSRVIVILSPVTHWLHSLSHQIAN